MTSPAASGARCRTCGQPHPYPDGLMPRHPFNDGSLSVTEVFGLKKKPTEIREAPWPFDPVLRQALINLGVITPEDLNQAESQIRAVTAQFERVTSNDASGTVSRS